MSDTLSNGSPADGCFEQVLAGILEAEEAGLKPDPRDYLVRFPEHAGALRDYFANRAAFERIAGILDVPSVSEPLAAAAPRGDDTVRPALQAGDVVSVPGYETRGCLGRGGMGEVLLVHDPDFGRSLAVKVMLATRVGQPGAEDRFLAEARITGRLQHPGIPPVHEVGRLPDGRQFMVMKQIQGHTLDDLLKERPTPSAELPRFVAIFGQICQAVGYAHGQGVIHRDLKPHNVMIGAFGEVQVMDWGLAKELRASPMSQTGPSSPERTAPFKEPPRDSETRTEDGAILGTASYLPPEAARGENTRVDERSDVFGLGAILCVILTGRPPFVGPDAIAVALQSGKGNVADAFASLDICGADSELIALARRCLSPEMDRRPRDGAEVAAAVQAYQAAVEERARRAEAERAAAQARAVEARATAAAERRARRMTLGLAVAAMLLVMAVGTVAWVVMQQRVAAAARQESADTRARDRMSQARELLKQGWKDHDFVRMADARAISEQAVEIATGARDAVRVEATLLSQEVAATLTRARKNRDLTATVLDVTEPRETKLYEIGEGGTMVASIRPSVDEQFADAFRRWGADLDRDPPEQVFAQLTDLPESVQLEIVAALDEWSLERRRTNRPDAEWQRLHDLAERLDANDSRRELRRIRISGMLQSERAVIALARAQSAGYPLSEPIEGPNARQLKAIAERMDREREPVLGVMALSRALEVAGETKNAEGVLRSVLNVRPNEVILLHALGRLLDQQPSRVPEAVEWYRVARGLRPQLGIALGNALQTVGRGAEGEEVLRDLVRRQPDNPESLFYLGNVLFDLKKLDEAVATYRKAIEFKPASSEAYNNLGNVLADQQKPAEAVAAYRKAIELRPDNPVAYYNLGVALWDRKKPDEAVAAYRKAIELRPDNPDAYYNLGIALRNQKKPNEAIAAYRKAIELRLDNPNAYNNLGLVLADQKKLDEAIAAYRKAIELRPDRFEAYSNLGVALRGQKKSAEAVAAYRKAIELRPDYPEVYYNLGSALLGQQKPNEAITTYRKAIELKPDYSEAYNDLGNVLADQQKPNEAVAAYRKAIEFKPDYAEAFNNLGVALWSQQKPAEAVAFIRKSIELKPDYSEGYNNLGNVLADQQKPDEAIAAYRKAIELKPDYSDAYYNLGNALYGRKKRDEAIAAYRKAIELEPSYPEAYVSLGNALSDQQKPDEAAAAYWKAIGLRPDYPEAYNNLGTALQDHKKLEEAVVAFRKADQLLPGNPLIDRNLRAAERWIELEKQFPMIQAGKGVPQHPLEKIELALFCKQYKEHHRAAVRFYADAFAAEPQLVNDLTRQHRFNAACCGLLAAAGKGKDTAELPEPERARLRKQALDGLRADLDAYTTSAEKNTAAWPVVQGRLAHWMQDTDLSSIRDAKQLAKLPEQERKSWEKLWTDVDALLRKVSKVAPGMK